MRPKENQTQACRAWEAQLEDYLEGRLDRQAMAELTNHLAACSGCRKVLADGRLSFRLLRAGAEPDANVRSGFANRIMAAICSEKRRRESWRPVEMAAWRLCWVATAAALLLTVVLMRVRNSAPAIATVQQSQVQTLVNVTLPQPVGADDTILLVAREDHAR